MVFALQQSKNALRKDMYPYALVHDVVPVRTYLAQITLSSRLTEVCDLLHILADILVHFPL